MANRVASKSRSVDELITFVVKHPIRVDALAILNERTASANEIARQLGVDLHKVSNHVTALAEAGCIELVKTEQKRGALQHFYRASMRANISDKEWAKLSEPARREISALVFQTIVAEGLGALRAGTFDSRADRHLSWRVMNLDEAGWEELVLEKAQSMERTEEIQARVDGRLAESGGQGFSAIDAALVFERARPGRSTRPNLGL